MSPFISVARRARRRPAPPVIAVLIAATVLLASFALPAFGFSPTKLISEALSTAKKADKEAKKADKDAKSADNDAKSSIVGTSRLQDGAVTASKIAAGAVGNGQLAGNSVGSNNIVAGSVGSAALAGGAVTSANLAEGAVTSAKLASGSVGGSQIAPRSVSLGDLSGTSTNTTFELPPVEANTCSTAEVSDAGAATSDFPMISFPGPTNLPLELSATALRVDIVGSVRVQFCNGTSVNAAAVTGVNIEVVTLR
jgi:hypothetical protein